MMRISVTTSDPDCAASGNLTVLTIVLRAGLPGMTIGPPRGPRVTLRAAARIASRVLA